MTVLIDKLKTIKKYYADETTLPTNSPQEHDSYYLNLGIRMGLDIATRAIMEYFSDSDF